MALSGERLNLLTRAGRYQEIIEMQHDTIQSQREILYRILAILDYGTVIPSTTVSDAEFSIEGGALVERLSKVIEEAKRAVAGGSEDVN